MAAVVERCVGPGGKLRGMMVFCPGCKCGHLFYTEPFMRDGVPGPVWTFNGDMESPTFSPSMLCNASVPAKDLYPNTTAHRCHSFVRDGQIQFLQDCSHELAGQTVPLEPVGGW